MPLAAPACAHHRASGHREKGRGGEVRLQCTRTCNRHEAVLAAGRFNRAAAAAATAAAADAASGWLCGWLVQNVTYGSTRGSGPAPGGML